MSKLNVDKTPRYTDLTVSKETSLGKSYLTEEFEVTAWTHPRRRIEVTIVDEEGLHHGFVLDTKHAAILGKFMVWAAEQENSKPI